MHVNPNSTALAKVVHTQNEDSSVQLGKLLQRRAKVTLPQHNVIRTLTDTNKKPDEMKTYHAGLALCYYCAVCHEPTSTCDKKVQTSAPLVCMNRNAQNRPS